MKSSLAMEGVALAFLVGCGSGQPGSSSSSSTTSPVFGSLAGAQSGSVSTGTNGRSTSTVGGSNAGSAGGSATAGGSTTGGSPSCTPNGTELAPCAHPQWTKFVSGDAAASVRNCGLTLNAEGELDDVFVSANISPGDFQLTVPFDSFSGTTPADGFNVELDLSPSGWMDANINGSLIEVDVEFSDGGTNSLKQNVVASSGQITFAYQSGLLSGSISAGSQSVTYPSTVIAGVGSVLLSAWGGPTPTAVNVPDLTFTGTATGPTSDSFQCDSILGGGMGLDGGTGMDAGGIVSACNTSCDPVGPIVGNFVTTAITCSGAPIATPATVSFEFLGGADAGEVITSAAATAVDCTESTTSVYTYPSSGMIVDSTFGAVACSGGACTSPPCGMSDTSVGTETWCFTGSSCKDVILTVNEAGGLCPSGPTVYYLALQ